MPPRASLLRVPYTDPLPLPKIIPATAGTASGAIAALVEFLSATTASATTSALSSPLSRDNGPRSGTAATVLSTSSGTTGSTKTFTGGHAGNTVLLTGAGISVASGLADYRGSNGTYTLNKSYRPIYYNEFCENHEARKRYWARSFLGWTNLQRAKPNAAHEAVRRLGELGVVGSVITQNVDSFHPLAHPLLPTIELHGYLRTLTCLTCHTPYPRSAFQSDLSALNPAWHAFLQEMLATGALDTENPDERKKRGLKSNPDGDVDIPGAPYTTFRYPACPVCVRDGVRVDVDKEGAWVKGSEGGVLKPSVVMFGESIPAERKVAAEEAVDGAGRLLVVGSSLATYSAWRLVKRAKENGMPIGILNIGGARGEDTFFADVPVTNTGREAVRCSVSADKVLPEIVKILERSKR